MVFGLPVRTPAFLSAGEGGFECGRAEVGIRCGVRSVLGWGLRCNGERCKGGSCKERTGEHYTRQAERGREA